MKLSRITFTDVIVTIAVIAVLAVLFQKAREVEQRNAAQIANHGFAKLVENRQAGAGAQAPGR